LRAPKTKPLKAGWSVIHRLIKSTV
jgi:hypothetical protein